MPTVEGLQFAYTLYPLPPGRLPFRRWRWEPWHFSHENLTLAALWNDDSIRDADLPRALLRASIRTPLTPRRVNGNRPAA